MKTTQSAYAILLLLLLFILFSFATCEEFSKEKIKFYRERVRSMFYHAYNGYLEHAYPLDELQPLSCAGMNTWGSFSLSLVDSLDTLLVMGNSSEFLRAARLVLKSVDVQADVNVSVFETNIRVVGGLLSAHMLSGLAGVELEPGWPCSGPLLRLAENMALRLLPAFNTMTGMPYGTVNLRYGVHRYETPITCTAGVGTFLLEFAAISRLSANPIFERVALQALRQLWKSRSSIGLVGNHINVETGSWTATDAGIGAGVDSYFEYLVKGAILLNKPNLMKQFFEYRKALETHVRQEDWHLWVTMGKGQVSLPVFQSLEAFWPGLLTIIGDVDSAMRILLTYRQVLKQYGFTPEFFNIPNLEAVTKRSGYPLRPELAESIMYAYRATGDPTLLQMGAELVEAIEHSAKTRCGYATVKNVKDHTLEDRMESFFLAETTKYLYLLFDEENFIHNSGEEGRLIDTPGGKCVVDAGGYIFNTEAHPIDPAILYCCGQQRQKDWALLRDFEENIDFLDMLGLADEEDSVSEEFELDEEDLGEDVAELGKKEEPPKMKVEMPRDELEYEVTNQTTQQDEVEVHEEEEEGQRSSLGVDAAQTKPSEFKVKGLLSTGQAKAKAAGKDLTDVLVKALESLAKDLERLVKLSHSLDVHVPCPEDEICPKDACRIIDRKTPSAALNRLLNIMYHKHRIRKQSPLKDICRPEESPKEEDNYRNVGPALDDLEEEPDDADEGTVDEIRMDQFRYKDLVRQQFELLSCPARPFLGRFVGLGQVMPDPPLVGI